MNQRLLLVALALGASPLAAQEPPDLAPAKELEAFRPLLGSWKGQGGGIAETPDGPQDFTWKGESEYALTYCGHWVMETTRIEVSTMGTLHFKSFLGFDRETGKYVVCGISNLGAAAHQTIHWPEKGVMLTAGTMSEGGVPSGERWVTTIGDDELKVRGHKWLGHGEEIPHVWGAMQRVDALTPQPVEASASIMPPPAEMEKLTKMCGDYRLKGGVSMAGAEVPMTATETMRAIFGGSVIEVNVQGDPLPGAPAAYEGWGAFAWDPANHCYSLIWIDNFGAVSKADARWLGDELVATTAGMKFGQPMVRRSVVKFTDAGKVAEVEEHELLGTGPAFKAFWAKYEPVM